MAKAILELGWTKYVLDLKDAVAVVEALSKAERYEEKYVRNGDNTHHIFDNNAQLGSLRMISDSLYQMAKLAGPPPEKD